MATAKQQQETEYTVTLKIAGSKVKAMAEAAKKIGVEVGGVEKIASTAPGEWATEWVEVKPWMNPVLVNTDGRIIQRFEKHDDSGNIIEGEYAHYRTRDAYGVQIADDKGQWHIETLEQAKALVRKPMTERQLLDAAEIVAAHIVKYGATDRDDHHDRVDNHAKSYLMGRGLEVPDEENGGDTDKRRVPRFIVTLTIKASTLPAVEKKAKAAFGDKLVSVEKVSLGFSRAQDLARAEEMVEEAAEIVHELKEDMESWRDNLPENFQGGQKEEELEAAASSLEEIEDALNGVGWDVEFPGMF